MAVAGRRLLAAALILVAACTGGSGTTTATVPVLPDWVVELLEGVDGLTVISVTDDVVVLEKAGSPFSDMELIKSRLTRANRLTLLDQYLVLGVFGTVGPVQLNFTKREPERWRVEITRPPSVP